MVEQGYFYDTAEELLRTFEFLEILENSGVSEEETLAFLIRKGFIPERGFS